MAEPEPRIESGAVVFGGDWPGAFIRGDDALYYAGHLTTVLRASEKGGVDLISLHIVRDLLQVLMAADANDPEVQRQQLKSARDCIASHPTLPGPPPDLHHTFDGG